MATVSVYNMEGSPVPCKQTSGDTEGQDPFRSQRRRQEAVAAERNRPCKAGFDQVTAVEGRRRRIRPDSEGLFI